MVKGGQSPATKNDLRAAESRLDRKLGGMGKRVGTLEIKFDILDKKVDALDKKVDALDKKVDALDKKVDAVDKKVDRVAVELVKTQARIGRVEDRMDGLATKDDIGRVLSAIDAFAGKAVHYDRASALHGHALTEHDAKLKDHDKRIQALESAPS